MPRIDDLDTEQRLGNAPGYNADLLTPVVRAADAVESAADRDVETALSRIMEATPVDEPAGRIARLFAGSLMARLSGDESESGNLYFEEPSPGTMLAAFNKLVEATPFIRFGYQAANSAILLHAIPQRALHLVDIGIGSGHQWFKLLDTLASGSRHTPRVHLTGIDVPMNADEPTRGLEEVGAGLKQHAANLGIRFSFEPVAMPVQAMDLSRLRRAKNETLIVNAVFALHHVPTCDNGKGIDSRNAVLSRIRRLEPDLLVMVEPDAEHNALPLGRLTRESIAHYLTVFDALAEMLPGQTPERCALEQAFFGREIRNIIGNDGIRRVERHERHSNWRRRLAQHGFAPVDLSGRADRLQADLSRTTPVSIKADREAMVLQWKGMPLVAAFASAPE